MPTLALVLWVTVGCLVLSTVTLLVLVVLTSRRLGRLARACDLALRRHQLALDRQARMIRQLQVRMPRPPRAPCAPQDWEDDGLDTRRSDAGETFLPVSFEHDLW